MTFEICICIVQWLPILPAPLLRVRDPVHSPYLLILVPLLAR